MNFQTSCMVFVTTEQQQIELEAWMKGIGWQIMGGRDSKPRFLVAETKCGVAMWMGLNKIGQELFSRDYHDCGENIEMFKALAAMNSNNDHEQWFVAHTVIRFDRLKDTVQTETSERLIMAGGWFKALIPRANNIRAKWMAAIPPKQLSHKATVEEIVEHFKKLEI